MSSSEWKPAHMAKPDGSKCALRFRDSLGVYEAPGPYFYHDDGNWYLIEPPTMVEQKPTHYKEI